MDPSTWRAIFMVKVQTSVMIDKDKRDLAKQKGIKLQDVLDNALNNILDLEVKGKAQLEIDKDNILKEIALKQKQKDEYLEKYQTDMMHLNMQLNAIDNELNKAIESQSELNKLNEYKDIIRVAGRQGFLDDEEILMQWVFKWRIIDNTGVLIQATEDLKNVYYHKLNVDDITLDDPVFKCVEDNGGN